MPIEKYRSGQEMNAAPLRAHRDDGFHRFLRHCARMRTLSARRFPRGVFKFRNLEELELHALEVLATAREDTATDS